MKRSVVLNAGAKPSLSAQASAVCVCMGVGAQSMGGLIVMASASTVLADFCLRLTHRIKRMHFFLVIA